VYVGLLRPDESIQHYVIEAAGDIRFTAGQHEQKMGSASGWRPASPDGPAPRVDQRGNLEVADDTELQTLHSDPSFFAVIL
jgi:hypothetical protein